MNLKKCPYCGASTHIVKATRAGDKFYDDIRGKEYMFCTRYPECDSYVACHDNGKPMGNVANVQLRYLRKQAHLLFDPLWESGKMSRAEAYKVLGQFLSGVPKKHVHISMFDEETCQNVISVLRQKKEWTLAVHPKIDPKTGEIRPNFEAYFLGLGSELRCVSVGENGCRSFYKYSVDEIQKYLDSKNWTYSWSEHWPEANVA